MKLDLHSILFSLDTGDAHPNNLTSDLLTGVGLPADASVDTVLSHYRLVVYYMPEYGEHADPDIVNAKITRVELLYNGFSQFQSPMDPSNLYGLRETQDANQPFDGKIRPILRFTFDRPVEEEAALASLESTCFQFMTPAMDDVGEVYELADHGGRSRIVDEDSECAVGDALVEAGLVRFDEEDYRVLFPRLEFEDGMDTHGYVIEWPTWFNTKE